MREGHTSWRSTFFGATAIWLVGLVGLIMVFQTWVGGPPAGIFT